MLYMLLFLLSGCGVTESFSISQSQINILDFGATADDQKEDTDAFVRAFDFAKKNDVATVYIPVGSYIINAIRLDYGLNIIGEDGTVLQKTAYAKKSSRMFTLAKTSNNKPYTISGITFDGNIHNQGFYDCYQLEQQHLIFVSGDKAVHKEDRVKATISNCFFKNGVADGITVYINADVEILDNKAQDIFRGALVFNGGNTKAKVENFEVLPGKIIPNSGIDFEVKGEGYDGTKKVEARLNNIKIEGKFHVGVSDHSDIQIEHIRTTNSDFYIVGTNSKIRINNGDFGIDPRLNNRIYNADDIVVSNSRFVINNDTPETINQNAIMLYWLAKGDAFQNNSVVFENCTFTKKTIDEKNGFIFVFNTENLMNNNVFILRNITVDKSVTHFLETKRGGRIRIYDSTIKSKTPFRLSSQKTNHRYIDMLIENTTFEVDIASQVLKGRLSEDVIIIR